MTQGYQKDAIVESVFRLCHVGIPYQKICDIHNPDGKCHPPPANTVTMKTTKGGLECFLTCVVK